MVNERPKEQIFEFTSSCFKSFTHIFFDKGSAYAVFCIGLTVYFRAIKDWNLEDDEPEDPHSIKWTIWNNGS